MKRLIDLIKNIFPFEIIFVCILLVVINLYFFPSDVGFLSTQYNPYFLSILFFTCFYGTQYGLISCIGTIVSIIGASILSDYYFNTDYLFSFINSPNSIDDLTTNVFIILISVIIFGAIRDNLGTVIRNQKRTVSELTNQIVKLKKELDAVSMVNQEYQDRILGQQNSLISLYSTIIALNSLNLETIYPNILKAVMQFTGALECSLWKYDRDANTIELLAYEGWDQEHIDNTPRIQHTENLIGWSVRNNSLFTIKMLQKYQNLKVLDNGRSILTVPITIDNLVWGAINIERLPFIKYNLYTEQLLLMIADLASPIIRNALRFSTLVHKEIDPITGFNSISEFYEVLKQEFDNAIRNRLNLSLLIVELQNAPAIVENFSHHDALIILKEISQLVQQLAKGKVYIFQYKETFQFAAILPNLDYDGAAMFSLSLIEQNSKKLYYIKGQTVFPEILLGYSSLRPNHQSEEDLIILAENLLLMQKI